MAQVQTQEQERRVELRIGKHKYIVTQKNGHIKVEKIYYPEWPMSNYVSHVISVYENVRLLGMRRVRFGWGGTGIDDMGEIVLNDNELQKIKEHIQHLIEAIKNKNYKAVSEAFKRLANYVYMAEKQREEMIEGALGELIKALEGLEQNDRLLQFLRSPEAKEKIKNCIYKYVYG